MGRGVEQVDTYAGVGTLPPAINDAAVASDDDDDSDDATVTGVIETEG